MIWSGAVSQEFLPEPAKVLSHFPTVFATASTWSAVGYTLEGWSIGLGISIAIGIMIGVLLGASHRSYRAARFVIDFCRSIPPIALLPLALLLFGASLRMKVFLIVAAAVWTIMVQTIHGFWDIDPVMSDTTRSYRLTRIQRLRWLVMPSVGTYIATAIRLASVLALFVAVGAEFLGSTPGIGLLLMLSQTNAQAPAEFDYALLIALMALVLDAVFRTAERRVLHWHPSHRLDRAA